MKLKEYAADWLDLKGISIKKSSAARYAQYMRDYLMPNIGDMELSDIDENIMQNFILKLVKKKLAHGTITLAISLAMQIVKSAVKRGLTPKTEFNLVYPKKDNGRRLKVLDAEAVQVIKEHVLNKLTPKSVGLLIAINTGMRIGELCSLQWCDIDIERGEIYVSKTMMRTTEIDLRGLEESKSKIIIGTPKTRMSNRTLPISETLLPILKNMRRGQNEENYVISGAKKYIEPVGYRDWYQRFLKRHGVEYIKFHGLRHTFATTLISNGADAKSVSELLGHANISETLKTYVHPDMKLKRRAIEMLKF
jgi:integrase